MDCYNSCPFRVNETSNPNRCECTACPNRSGSTFIASDRTLSDKEYEYSVAAKPSVRKNGNHLSG